MRGWTHALAIWAGSAVVLLASVSSRAVTEPARQAMVVNQGPPVTSGQNDPVLGTGIVSGVVVDASTDQPVSGAVVSLALAGTRFIGQQSRQVTDSRGRFVFIQVPAADRLRLAASRPGYMPGGYDSDEGVGARLGETVLAEGQWLSDVRIELSKLGSISGTVFDEAGEPVVGVYVRALAVIRLAGRERLAAGPVARTDDRGEYRLADIMPGRYRVVVPSVQATVPATSTSAEVTGRPSTQNSRGPLNHILNAGQARVVVGPYPIPPPPVDGRARAYPMTFHPGVASLGEATTLELALGERRTGANIRLLPLPVVELSGRVEGPPEAWSGLNLRLLSAGLEELGLGSEAATALVGSDGAFWFANVTPGTYVIEAPTAVFEYRYSQLTPFGPMIGRPPGVSGTGSYSNNATSGTPGTSYTRTTLGGERSMSGRMTVTVGETNLTGLVLTLRPTARVTGRVEFELDPNQEKPAQLPGVQVRAEPADGSAWLGLPRVSADRNDPNRSFALEGLLPGRYLLRSGVGTSWIVKRIVHDGRDYTDAPVDASAASTFEGVVITVTNRVARLDGSVRNGQGGPATGARVVLFPTDRTLWSLAGMSPPRVRSAITNNLGGFQVRGLPAGAYYVVALADARRMDWRDPAFFERAVAWAESIGLDWGESVTRDLVAVEVPR